MYAQVLLSGYMQKELIFLGKYGIFKLTSETAAELDFFSSGGNETPPRFSRDNLGGF